MFFLKKKPDIQAMESFWKWFQVNQDWVIKNTQQDTRDVSIEEYINAIDQRLTPCFPYFPASEIQFQLGYNDGAGEFFFFDLGNKNLNRDAILLAEMMPADIQKNWKFIIEH